MVFQWIWNSLDQTNLLLIAFTIFFLFAYHFVLKNYWYFSKRNIKFIRGWPIIGSLHGFFFGDKSFADAVLGFYRRFPDESVIGIYEFTHPVFIIRDPDLIKRITVQDFEHFLNHQGNFDVEGDSLLARSLFFSRDQQWKEMRTILSPAFTGNKMRLMFDLIRECTTEFMQALKTFDSAEGGFDIEQKDLLSRYATNIIATCAFGLRVDAVTERDNEFFLSGKTITNFDSIQGIKFLLFDAMPKVMKFLRIQFIEKKLCDYFRNVVNTAIAYREENHILRPDMINLLMQAKKGTLSDDGDETATNKTNWHDDDLVAQCIVFFFAGFETMSTLLCFMGHELACNQDIQQRLYEDIMEIERKLNGAPITYETIQNFKYMDMVVSETLRLWPPISGSDRQVTKPYKLEGKDGQEIILTTKDSIWFPIYGLHLDPKYWIEPNRFDPERFSDENRKNIQSGTYLPFGSGQRVCIASRFALMVAKTVFYFILKEYKIEKCSRTPNPVILKPNSINMHAKDGFWVRFQPRQN